MVPRDVSLTERAATVKPQIRCAPAQRFEAAVLVADGNECAAPLQVRDELRGNGGRQVGAGGVGPVEQDEQARVVDAHVAPRARMLENESRRVSMQHSEFR
jgi:hypothetical protein